MSTLLTQMQLENHLHTFRNILGHFDYSSLENVRFFNLDSFYAYMDNVKDNPFEKQYNALQKELDYIQPYLPFVSSKRAQEFLDSLATTNSDDEIENVKKEYTQKLRQDFINFSKTITTHDEWVNIITTCEEIRLRKEEMLLALQ